jgi:hypothetical protein
MKQSLRRLVSPTSRFTPSGRARRRYNCGDQDAWQERAVTAAELWRANAAAWRQHVRSRPLIADFGAGNERMRAVLEIDMGEEYEYRPFDKHPQRPATAQLDAARELPEEDFDLALCLGLIEYLPSIEGIAGLLARSCRFALISYVIADGTSDLTPAEREERGWINHATCAEVAAAFATAGFREVAATRCDADATALWLWQNVGSLETAS